MILGAITGDVFAYHGFHGVLPAVIHTQDFYLLNQESFLYLPQLGSDNVIYLTLSERKV